jgi:hypothetical protein
MKDTVIFRVMNGEVIALFPYIVAHDTFIISYQHAGQHGAADYDHCIANSRAATKREAAPLLKELQKIGYSLQVIKRARHRTRMNAIYSAVGCYSFNELRARELSMRPRLLRKRLEEARAVLTNRKQFGKSNFDFANKRLVGENGLHLQWQTRQYPDQPESYENQQTNRGFVILTRE